MCFAYFSWCIFMGNLGASSDISYTLARCGVLRWAAAHTNGIGDVIGAALTSASVS